MDNEERPSRSTQWQESGQQRPTVAKVMTDAQIEELRRNLVKSYKCADEDIDFDFIKFRDENGEDRTDFLLLIFKMKTIWEDKLVNRTIFSLKLPIPEHVKMRATHINRDGIIPVVRQPVRK